MGKLIAILTLSFTIIAQANIITGPEKMGKSSSGITGREYSKMKQDLRKLAQKHPTLAKIVELGKSENGTDIIGVLISMNPNPKKLIAISGSTHGNEYLGIADRLIEKFLSPSESEFQEYYLRGGAFFVIPVFNPDGYRSNMRYNGNFKDLNRDYSNLITDVERFTQSETRNSARWIESFIEKTGASLEVSMDYHCCYGGALLFPWGFTKDQIESQDRAEFNAIGESMTQYFTDNPRFGATSEIIWYLADGTSHDYWYAKYGTLSMTYEGRYRNEEDLLSNHVQWWKDIVSRQ